MEYAVIFLPLIGSIITYFGKRIGNLFSQVFSCLTVSISAVLSFLIFYDGIINGNYGNYIIIRHNSIYKTAYGHLSKIRKNAFNGKFVKQGEIIGYVGSTGRSTGPHLHYEILVNNKKVNPLTVILPSTKNIRVDEIDEFKKQVKNIEKIIGNGIKPEFAQLSN